MGGKLTSDDDNDNNDAADDGDAQNVHKFIYLYNNHECKIIDVAVPDDIRVVGRK